VSSHRAEQVNRDADHGSNRGQAGCTPGLVPLLKSAQVGLRTTDLPRELAEGETLGLASDSDPKADDRVDVVHEPNIREANTKSQGADIDLRIGARVKGRRGELRITQAAFSKLIGVSQPRLSQMENGAPWTAQHVSAACAALRCQPSDLMDESPSSELQARVIDAMNAGDYIAAIEAVTAYFKRGN